MFTIDTHTHIIPKQLPDFSQKFGYGDFITLDHHQEGRAWMMQGKKRFREIVANCWDPAIRIEEMKQHQADMQVICTIPVMFSYWADAKDGLVVSQFLNDDIASTVSAFPDKFIDSVSVERKDYPLC
jgi:aminocarboxymuconate-semialdehyde decarboxylase